MMRKCIALAVFYLSISSGYLYSGGLDEFSYTHVSMVEIISAGDKYDGWELAVIGVVHYDQESSLLYLSKEKYLIQDTASSIFLDLDNMKDEDLLAELLHSSGKNIFVTGKFSNIQRTRVSPNEIRFGPWFGGVLSEIKEIKVVE